MKYWHWVILVLFVGMMVAGCGKETIVGAWQAEGPLGIRLTICYNSDHSGYFTATGLEGIKFRWQRKGDKLILVYSEGVQFTLLGEGMREEVPFTLQGNVLILHTGGEEGDLVFHRIQ